MGKGSMKENENVYFRARKEAAIYNEKLFSREGAAELLGISVSTLADYELGNTKVVPVDKVMLMSDLYNAPDLKYGYCKYECPIGKMMPFATKVNGLETTALHIIRELDSDQLHDMKKKLLDIVADGVISINEETDFGIILRKLDAIAVAISEMKMIGEKTLKG